MGPERTTAISCATTWDNLHGHIQITLLLPYPPDLNPVEYLWAWLKRHAMANYSSAT